MPGKKRSKTNGESLVPGLKSPFSVSKLQGCQSRGWESERAVHVDDEGWQHSGGGFCDMGTCEGDGSDGGKGELYSIRTSMTPTATATTTVAKVAAVATTTTPMTTKCLCYN